MYLCIDIGGTKTLTALIDDARNIKNPIRFPTNHDQSQFFTELFAQIKNYPLDDLRAVTIAVPGPTTDNKPTDIPNLPQWTDLDLSPKLAPLLPPSTPIFLQNDANLAALAEAENLEGTTMYLTLSTGIGGAIIKNNQTDPDNPNFEPGHHKHEFNGKPTEWEDFASAKAIVDHFGKLTTEITDPATWAEIATRISIGLIPILNEIEPAHLILGGPLGLALPNYRLHLEQHLRSANTPIPDLLTAKYKHQSVLIGCLIYAQRQLSHQ